MINRSAICLFCILGTVAAFLWAGPVQGFPESDVHYGEIGLMISRWDIPAAREALDGPAVVDGEAKLWLEGMVEFYSGNYREAVELLDQLPSREGPSGRGLVPLPLVRDTLKMRSRMSRRESEHFILLLSDKKDWILADPALDALEKAYRAMGDWLGYRPEHKIRVEIVPTAEDFERISSLKKKEIQTSGAVGICKFNKIMLLSPRLLLQGYRWRDTLAHEYIHYLVVRLTANRSPIWLQEGVARHGERKWRSDHGFELQPVEESLLGKALREDALVSFAEMDPSLVRLPDMNEVRLAFAECATAVDYLLSEWKEEGLRRLFSAIADGGGRETGTDGALKEAIGLGMGEFETRWRAFLETREYREYSGLRIPAPPVMSETEGEAVEEWDLEAWQPLEARKHIKLGDMLRSRQRYNAGLREYRKALKISPVSPYVLNRVGRALMDLRRPKEAEAVLRTALSLHPDYPASYTNLARVLSDVGRWEESAAVLMESIEINPFNYNAWKDLAYAQRESGDEGEAWRSAETAYRLNPSDRELKRMLGKDR